PFRGLPCASAPSSLDTVLGVGTSTRQSDAPNRVCEIGRMRVAILDDYQDVALTMADWSQVADRATITVFNDHLGDPDAVVERLKAFDVVCVMRGRTPLPRSVIERLPRLKMIASTGPFNASIDVAAAKERGIYVSGTGG